MRQVFKSCDEEAKGARAKPTTAARGGQERAPPHSPVSLDTPFQVKLLRHLQRLQSVASNFSPMHLDEAFKLGQRLYADRYMGITFHGPRSAWWETHDKPDDLMQPYIHVDTNLGNQYDSNPQIGAVVMIAGGCVQGSSQRIKLACDSTAYAEMCAAVHGTKIAMQLTSFACQCQTLLH